MIFFSDTKNKTVYLTNILHISLTQIFAPNLQRRSSKDVRGDSVSEWEKRLEKPSVPLMAKGPPGPPKIVEIEEKYSAIEGEHYYQTGVIVNSIHSVLLYSIVSN